MASQTTSPSQIITLPKGGGAQQGIGEKFSPDLHTGTGNFTVPIALPPGRNGFQPQLNLVYSTGNGNGLFGLGWSLGIPGVTRKTSHGIPRYRDYDRDLKKRDLFILSGAEDLVPVKQIVDEPGKKVVQYRPRTEGLFARIRHHDEPAKTNYWEVRSKDGLVSRYGTPRPPGAADDWSDPAVIRNPARPEHIFAWKLTETHDPFSNRILYSYTADQGETKQADTVVHRWNQPILHRIRYVDYGDRNNPSFLISVTFDYEERPRPDPYSEYRAGFEIRTTQRCASITIRTHAERIQRFRTYRFDYDNDPHNGCSLLRRVHVIGHSDADPAVANDEGQPVQELPPLEFRYSQFEPEKRKFIPILGTDLPPRSLANPDLELVDVIGNGLPHVIEMNGTGRYWRNVGGGEFALPREMREAPAGVGLADPDVQMIDANGDGRMDLLVTTQALSGYYPLKFGGQWDRRSFQKYGAAPSFSLKDPEVRLVDLTGDGVTDVIRSGTRLECHFNDPIRGWDKDNVVWVERQPLQLFPNVNFSDSRVRFADMTGDGMQDIVLVHDGNIEYWPSLGYGNWGKRIHMENSPIFPYGYDPKRILLGDVDGDGCADLVYVDYGKVTLWINRGGNDWSDPIEITGTPPISDMDSVRLVDLLGNGISGVLWSADRGTLGQSHMYFLDFTGGIKPYLLNEMDNHMGAVTKVEYKSSTHFYLDDEKRPETRWKTYLPFPVQVVAKVQVIDEISTGKLATEYRYHHGYWDGAEHEFRGFGMVEQLDTETFEIYNQAGLRGYQGFHKIEDRKQFSPPTLTKTWFHQGPVGEEFGEWEELEYTREYWRGDPPALTRPAEVSRFIKALPRRVQRDAIRTMRGTVLRTELYSQDGSEWQDRPYTVTETLYGVHGVLDEDAGSRLLRTEGELPDEWQTDVIARVVFPHRLAQRTTQWERGDEPMTQFIFAGQYDVYGLQKSQLSVAVPRGRDFKADLTGSDYRPYLATLTHSTYAQRDDQAFIVDRVAETSSYEIPYDGGRDVLAFKDAIERGEVKTELIARTLNYYDGKEFEGHPFQMLGVGNACYGALVRTKTLALTADLLKKVYKSGDDIADPEAPPYLMDLHRDQWPNEYLGTFVPPPAAGYKVQEGRYYIHSERRKYDFHEDAGVRGRGHVIAKRDPLGHETTVSYDAYDFLPEKVKDAAGLVTKAAYNPRVLQASLVTDPNGNRSRYSFTPLGMLRQIEVIGKESQKEGDTQEQPSTLFLYDFLAFVNSPPKARQPIAVHAVRRLEHYWTVVQEENERREGNRENPLTKGEIEGLFPRGSVLEGLAGLPKEVNKHPDRFVQTREYSDGFGRLLQTRTQGEAERFGNPVFGGGESLLPSDQNRNGEQPIVGETNDDPNVPNVVVTGWQTYDNKGQVVEKYEPFFSEGWEYRPPTEAERGQKVVMFYDPRGHVIRTMNPDDSEQRVIYGSPVDLNDLSDPDQFVPTPWEVYTYDTNDNAGRTHPDTSASYDEHWNTPSSIEIDALGRTVKAIERIGSQPDTEWYTTRSRYDIRGNLLEVRDALGRKAFTYVYDLLNRPWRIESLDAGIRRTVLDAAGNILERRDSKGALLLQTYDDLNRPTRLWARNRIGAEMHLRERMIYGDDAESGLTTEEARSKNLLGKLYQHDDEAGRLRFTSYDFKGNLLEKERRILKPEKIIEGVIDAEDESLLEKRTYQTSTTYDALNRITSLRYPDDGEGRKILRPHYNKAGALERIQLQGEIYVEHIAYNAKGQRVLIAYGNGVMTRYAYDERTFRLRRMRTEGYIRNDLTYRPHSALLQDFAYEYDLVGNIIFITDRSPGCGVRNNPQANGPLAAQLSAGQALVRQFEYDSLYRLTSATGRECRTISLPRPWFDQPWPDHSRCGFYPGAANQNNARDVTNLYIEKYDYDAAGNLLAMKHRPIGTGADPWTRFFGMGGMTPFQWEQKWPAHVDMNQTWNDAPGNQLTHVGDDEPQVPQTHEYDNNGNLVKENGNRHYAWDHNDRLKAFWVQGGDHTTQQVLYRYDASGQRVVKLSRKQQDGFYDVRIYIDGIYEHYRWKQESAAAGDNCCLQVMDNQARIVIKRVGDSHPDDAGPDVQFHVGDHLGSSSLVLNKDGLWTNREEYFPYGETSFGSFAIKRYRFTGKERDEESGLYYHGARYYAASIARWISCDPAGNVDSDNRYIYAGQSPCMYRDEDGLRMTPASNQLLARVGAGGTAIGGTSGAASFGGIALGAPAIAVAGAAAVTVGIWVYAITNINKAVKSYHELQEAKRRADEMREHIDRSLKTMLANGEIAYEDFLRLTAQGQTPGILVDSNGAGGAKRTSTVEVTGDPKSKASSVYPPSGVIGKNKTIGQATESMAHWSLEEAGIPHTMGGGRTLKNASGKSATDPFGSTRKPDIVLHGESNIRSGVEIKASDTGSTRGTTAKQLAKERQIISNGAYWKEGDTLLPYVQGEGSGVTYGPGWLQRPAPKGTVQ